ncbi:hypothetical protein HK097_000467 [Rhizophlyctis rosea]|uniref:VID27 cytoplasmic protein n=1 Tax=Rhizophlyctis rosea TaxID=64517 RepID=A0AAD5SHD2_9FUNG|nr:hypothetical protein HK097_000467 [Rhizophlyctis rosea]
MFLLKAVSNILFGKTDDNLIQLPSGQLFRLDPSNPKGGRELVFKDAAATIRRTTTPYNYTIVITRVYEEGEDELDRNESDDPDDLLGDGDNDEKSFLIDEVLRFRRLGGRTGPQSLIWAEASDVVDKSNKGFIRGWEFAVDPSTADSTSRLFEETIYGCMFERQHSVSHADASDADFANYVEKVKAAAAGCPIGTKSKTSTPQKPATTPRQQQAQPSAASPASPKQTLPPLSKPVPPTGEVVADVEAQLYLFDVRVNHFVPMRDIVTVQIMKVGNFRYNLVVKEKEDGTAFISQPLEDRMNPVFSGEHHSFIWVWVDEAGRPIYSWSLKFNDETNENAFKHAFTQGMYETLNEEKFTKVKKDEQDYLMNAYQEDVEMADAFEDAEEGEEWEEEKEEDEEEGEEAVGGADSEDEDLAAHNADRGSKNSQLAVGYKHDRSFVVRGNKIGVFKHTEDDQLKFATTINNVKTLDGKVFSPRKVMLHNQDSSMLMMNPTNEYQIYRMDLERGTVVEEWKVHDHIKVDEMVPDTKYAQLTPQQTLIGLNRNALFRIDPRLGGNKLVEEQSKQYESKTDFNCAATTGKGELAVGSSKGEIRMFNKLGIRAKTALPGLGDPIIGIDTTENGRWIIATCRNYLLLIDTEIPGEGGSTGFTKAMGQKKPVPKRLQLKPEHVAWMGMPVSFTPARFNTGEGEEKSIVTSSGPYVITWNFRRAKQGRLYDYSMKKYTDNVVADNFKYGQDKALIVTLPENVEMVTKSKLQTPVKLMKSRNAYVNSPY